MPKSGTRNAKRVQPAKKIERQGIALIGSVVADMGHFWNEPQNDFGTDGFIELVDPQADKAANRIVLVQSKATSVAFGERPVAFTCDSGVSIKDYFQRNPKQRETRRIVFDRDEDRFDKSAARALWDLGRPRHDGLHLGTPPVHESLVSNLLPVERFPETIYVADTRARNHREARARFDKEPGRWPRSWILWAGRVCSFTHPEGTALGAICDGPIASFPSSNWAYSEDKDERRRFVWLLKAALDEQMRSALRSSRDLTWVAATDDLPVSIAIPGTSNTRAIVNEYRKDDGTLRYVRHLGFAPAFACYAEQWYLEITPTYHFTRDGRQVDSYAASHRSGIKRIERHADFRRNVDSLALVLRGDVDLGGLTPDPDYLLLEFGDLESVRLDTSGDAEDEVAVDSDDGLEDEE